MNDTLINAYNYFENHKEYGYEDIPEEDIVNIINLHNAIVEAMSQLAKDGRIVSADCGYPTHDGKGSIKEDSVKQIETLSSVLLYKVLHQYGKVEFIDKNDKLVQKVDVNDLSSVGSHFYKLPVYYTELLPTDNPYRDELVARIKFVDRTKEELLSIKLKF